MTRRALGGAGYDREGCYGSAIAVVTLAKIPA
jgi:hypothetical protein